MSSTPNAPSSRQGSLAPGASPRRGRLRPSGEGVIPASRLMPLSGIFHADVVRPLCECEAATQLLEIMDFPTVDQAVTAFQVPQWLISLLLGLSP